MRSSLPSPVCKVSPKCNMKHAGVGTYPPPPWCVHTLWKIPSICEQKAASHKIKNSGMSVLKLILCKWLKGQRQVHFVNHKNHSLFVNEKKPKQIVCSYCFKVFKKYRSHQKIAQYSRQVYSTSRQTVKQDSIQHDINNQLSSHFPTSKCLWGSGSTTVYTLATLYINVQVVKVTNFKLKTATFKRRICCKCQCNTLKWGTVS
jgi:hypothetical protein